MRRKVIKQGHNTLTITLPSSWVNKFNIKTGDELDVREQGKILSIGTEKSSGTSSIEKIPESINSSSFFFDFPILAMS